MTTDPMCEVRANILESNFGTADAQKDALVTYILDAFRQPDKWPVTDAERVALLKHLYTRANNIRTTEAARK